MSDRSIKRVIVEFEDGMFATIARTERKVWFTRIRDKDENLVFLEHYGTYDEAHDDTLKKAQEELD